MKIIRMIGMSRVLALFAALSCAADENQGDPAAKHLPEEFPVAMTFRGSDTLHGAALEKRLKESEPYQVIHAPGNTDNSRIISKRWPKKMVTDQMAYGGVGGDAAPRVWPGHFLYKVGTKLKCDIRSGDTVLQVENPKQLAREGAEPAAGTFPVTFTIYAIDSDGKPDWSKAEHVTLVKVSRGELTVKRGQWGSSPRSFKAGKAVVAAHMMFWSHQFQLNLSLHCPRGGPNDLTAAEWFAREIADRIKETGSDGVELDVGRWTWGYPKMNAMDCNNDLLPDYGYIDGVNSFGLGNRVLFREARKLLGPNKIIQVDSNDPIYGIRGWDYLNGVQLECFPLGNRFDLFSVAFLHLRRWVEEVRETPHYSYGFTKVPTTVFSGSRQPDGSPEDFHFRIGLAADCLVGMPHPFASIDDPAFDPANESDREAKEQFGVFKWDEYFGGDLNNWHWLGKPLAPAQQYLDDLAEEDLLAGVSWDWKTDKKFETADRQTGEVMGATVKRIPEQTIPSDLWFGVRLDPEKKLSPALKPNQEYTLVFDVRGDDTWLYAEQEFPRVPRMVAIKGIGESKNSGGATASVLAEDEWKTCRISLATSAEPDSGLSFGVSEQIGRTEIKNIRLYEGGAERWSRDFEHGKILLNMAKHPWKLDVGNGCRRLKGTQCPEINNGAEVNGTIEVPAWDAVFLVKE